MTITTLTRGIKWAVVNQWRIVDPKILDMLDFYHLTVMDGADIAEENQQGELIDYGIRYKLNFIDTPVNCYRNKCAVSFRRIRGQDVGYALIKVYRHGDNNNG